MRQIRSNLSKHLIILIGIAIIPAFRFVEQPKADTLGPFDEAADLKQAAFEILHTKCNICHERKNPRRVFTLKNMSDLAPKINKQVFIKERMPKGDEIQLTDKEYDTLKKWLFTEIKF